MTMQALDVTSCPLTGTTLIEASAGTGKTWAICGLVLRLIVERGVSVSEILVVTFTKAATAELRERIRARLRESLDQNPAETIKARLETALAAFDEAAIFTIHGYCQRALGDAPLTAGQPFELTLGDDQTLCREVTADFWRQSIATVNDPLLAAYLVKHLSPAKLDAQLRRRMQKPLAQYCWPKGLDVSDQDASPAADLPSLYAKARSVWQQSGEDALQALLAAVAEKSIHGATYKIPVLQEGAAVWASWFESENPPDELPPTLCQRWCASILEDKKNKGKTPPIHAVFDAIEVLWRALEARQDALEFERLRLLRDFLESAPAELQKRKRARRMASFDDLLGNLHRALSGDGGVALAENLAKRFPVALIDEFQDTDPLQFDIFRRIYQGPPVQEASAAAVDRALFLVGDPKQAIYSFRQADLQTYLQARDTADQCFYLPNNQRSSRELIDAVNALFSARELPFMLPGLDFKAVGFGEKQRGRLLDSRESGETSTSTSAGTSAAALCCWFLPMDQPLSKDDAMAAAANACAREMADLLGGAGVGKVALQAADGSTRGLRAGDLAVLVRTHKQGQLMKRALANVGLAAAELSSGSVFASAEAADLEVLLMALAEPGRPARLRTALASPLLGFDALDLVELNEQGQTEWVQRLQQGQQRWLRQGLAVALLRLLAEWGISKRLLNLPEGERKLTNLLHLIELAHEFEQSCGQVNPAALLRWLGAQRAEPYAAGEAAQLRLESDEKLVRIVTIHRSKGLEYPVVFCPFVWEGPSVPRVSLEGAEYPLYPLQSEGDGDPAAAIKTVRCVDFRGDDEPALVAGKQQAAVEDAAETLRLLYVALTRAVHRCYLVVGPYLSGKASLKNSQQALLNWLVAGHGDAAAWVKDGGDWAAIQSAWEKLAADQPNVSWLPLPSAIPQPNASKTREGQEGWDGQRENLLAERPAPERPPSLAVAWRLDSFTGLLRGAHIDEATHTTAETPAADHDALAVTSSDDILMFERGARAGECIHAVFEHADFGDPETWPAAINHALQMHASQEPDDLSAARLQHMLADVLNTPLPGFNRQSLALAQVNQRDRLTELEFSLPVLRLSADELWAICQRHEVPVPRLAFKNLAGYLRGFIDLVFRVQSGDEPIYYLLDWKSNYLGDHPDDYRAEVLQTAMLSHGYFLQALIYSVALHRHLRLNLPNYDPERHFGGAFYLFVRGVRPDWPNAGVVHWRPSLALLDELDNAFHDTGNRDGE